MKDAFVENRSEREEIGVIYRLLSERFEGDITIEMLDPRNILAIAGYFLQQMRRKRITFREGIRHFFFHLKRGALFVNGHYVSEEERTGKDLFQLVEAHLQ